MCGFSPQAQLRVMRRKRLRVRLRDRLAHLDRAVAVGAHFTPVDGEHRAFTTLHLRQRPLAQDRDELLAERPRSLLVDIALQAEQAPLGYLSCGDFVHDGPLSTQSVDEVVGELAARVVYGLDLPPVRRYPLCGINRIAYEQFLYRGKRQFKLTEHRNEARRFELRGVVVAIAGGFVDTRGNQHAKLVVETQRLNWVVTSFFSEAREAT